jgi:hypothetical protein
MPDRPPHLRLVPLDPATSRHAIRPDVTTSHTTDGIESGQWMTYAAAAEHLGLTTEAVRQRARRGRWRRTLGNDGRTLVLVPHGANASPSERSRSGIETLAYAVEVLRDQALRAEARAEAERTRADALQARLDQRGRLHRLWCRWFNRH